MWSLYSRRSKEAITLHWVVFIKALFHFFTKHFVLKILCLNPICSPILGNHSYLLGCSNFYVMYRKKFSWNGFLVIECIFKIFCLCESCSRSYICTYLMVQVRDIVKSLIRLLMLLISMLLYLECMKKIQLQR